METLTIIAMLEMALSQSRHGSRIKLSPEEMLDISERISRDFSPIYSSPISPIPIRLSASEMRSISDEISRDFALRPEPGRATAEIVLLPVDPDHLHAYWHFQQPPSAEQPPRPMTLRIYPMPDRQPAGEPGWLDLPIEPGLTQHKVTVPPSMSADYYSAAIGWRQDDQHFAEIACSEAVFIPRSAGAASEPERRRPGEPRVLRDYASGRGKRDR